jgi:hypothetical protein
MSDSVEAILEFHSTRIFGTRENAVARAHAVRGAYEGLSNDEIADLANKVLDGVKDPNRLRSIVLRCVACFQPGKLSAFHERMIGGGIFHPGVVYYGAGAKIGPHLINILEGGGARLDTLLRNHLLVALAWIGDSNVRSSFMQWRRQPPKWASLLHIAPHEYAKVAGWELTDDGGRRNLFSDVAYPLVRSESKASTRDDVKVGVHNVACCPWCGRTLTSLFGIRNLQGVLPEYPATKYEALTCHACTAYGQVFAKRSTSDSWTWHQKNVRPGFLPPRTYEWAFPETPLVPSTAARSCMLSADWLLPDVAYSQVGGHPTWVQDSYYPNCPDCSATMVFVGQISNEDYDQSMEGIYYAFSCSECGVSATNYQQS